MPHLMISQGKQHQKGHSFVLSGVWQPSSDNKGGETPTTLLPHTEVDDTAKPAISQFLNSLTWNCLLKQHPTPVHVSQASQRWPNSFRTSFQATLQNRLAAPKQYSYPGHYRSTTHISTISSSFYLYKHTLYEIHPSWTGYSNLKSKLFAAIQLQPFRLLAWRNVAKKP